MPFSFDVKILKSGLAATALVGLASSGAYAASTTFDATANIQTAISIVNSANLNFANIVPDPITAGAVIVNTSGGRTCDPALSCSGTTAAAAFDVTGTSGATYALTLPTSANITSGANTMLVDTFVSSIGATGTLAGGAESFNIGGTLNVGAAQPTGAYAGTFTVNVEYN